MENKQHSNVTAFSIKVKQNNDDTFSIVIIPVGKVVGLPYKSIGFMIENIINARKGEIPSVDSAELLSVFEERFIQKGYKIVMKGSKRNEPTMVVKALKPRKAFEVSDDIQSIVNEMATEFVQEGSKEVEPQEIVNENKDNENKNGNSENKGKKKKTKKKGGKK